MTVQELNIIVGNNIKFYRKKLKLTQLDLANQMGLDDQSIHRWERGLNFPSILSLIILISILKIEIYQLFMEGKYEGSKK